MPNITGRHNLPTSGSFIGRQAASFVADHLNKIKAGTNSSFVGYHQFEKEKQSPLFSGKNLNENPISRSNISKPDFINGSGTIKQKLALVSTQQLTFDKSAGRKLAAQVEQQKLLNQFLLNSVNSNVRPIVKSTLGQKAVDNFKNDESRLGGVSKMSKTNQKSASASKSTKEL